MLFLNKQSIRQAITMSEVIDAIDIAYNVYHSKEFQMPTRLHIQDKNNTLLVMPGITNEVYGTKLVTVFPKNKTVPIINGLVVLNSSTNGEIKALLDGSFLTGLRTGAIGGSAVRHLAKEDASELAIIGTGVQGLYQAVAACSERAIKNIYLYNRTKEKMTPFKTSLQSWIGNDINIHLMDSAVSAVQKAEIIMTATTSSDPVLPDDPSLLENKLIIGIGSYQPSMREFPKSLYNITRQILVDSEDAIHESGDLMIPIDQGWLKEEKIQTMGSYLASNEKNFPNKGGVVFKSTGMALFDVVVANLIYEQALEKKLGLKLEF